MQYPICPELFSRYTVLAAGMELYIQQDFFWTDLVWIVSDKFCGNFLGICDTKRA